MFIFFRLTEQGVSKIDITTGLSIKSKANTIEDHQNSAENLVSAVANRTNQEDRQDYLSTEISNSIMSSYDEVSASDILYPKEKYKYHYDRSLSRNSLDDSTSDVYVYRAGKLVPLTSVIKKKVADLALLRDENKDPELVYVYDDGKMLMLGGSLCKVNPSEKNKIKAKIVLPIGVTKLQRKAPTKNNLNTIKTVLIDEKLARYALTALRKGSDYPHSRVMRNDHRSMFSNSKYSNSETKVNKSNILDIISAKLDLENNSLDELNHKSEFDFSKSKSSLKFPFKNDSKSTSLFKKNLHRFPSLSREMKRLSMNFVNMDASEVIYFNI